MEFEGLIVNLGVRYEVLAPGESFGRAMDHVTWNHYNSLTRWRNVPIVDSPTQTAISPRLGISHPITRSFHHPIFHRTLPPVYRSAKSLQPHLASDGTG